MSDRIYLKEQLKSLLELKGLSASELARKSGVPKQSLSDWLAGAQPRKLAHLKRVADTLGVSVDVLCFAPCENITNESTPAGDWMEGVFEVQGRIRKK